MLLFALHRPDGNGEFLDGQRVALFTEGIGTEQANVQVRFALQKLGVANRERARSLLACVLLHGQRIFPSRPSQGKSQVGPR